MTTEYFKWGPCHTQEPPAQETDSYELEDEWWLFDEEYLWSDDELEILELLEDEEYGEEKD